MKNMRRSSKGDRIFQLFNYIHLTSFMIICIFPFYYVIINTISANNLVDMGKILFWPVGIHLSNYLNIIKLPRIGMAFSMSVARTVLGTLFAVFGSSYLGYLFTKEKMWMRKFWYRFVIITMYFSAGLIPTYLTIRALGLMNNFWVYVIPGMFPVFNMILVKTYIEQISPALEESAQIDGAGYLKRYLFIILPLSIPILATVAVYTAVLQWNSFMDTVLYISDFNLQTLQFLLYEYFKKADSLAELAQSGVNPASVTLENMITPTSVRLTITVVITFPILLVYPFMQRYFIKGLMIGAVKG